MLDSVTTESLMKRMFNCCNQTGKLKVKHDGKEKTNTYYVEATNNNPKIINH